MSEVAQTSRCPACGYPRDADACTQCRGEVRCAENGKHVRAAVGNPVGDFVHGFSSLFTATIALVHRREYMGKLALAVVANLVVLSATLALLFWGAWGLIDQLFAAEWGALDILRSPAGWLAFGITFVLAAIVLYLTSPVLIETVMSPFLDPIAAATEKAWCRTAVQAVDMGFWGGIVYSLRASAKILLIQLLLLIPLLLLALTGIGAIVALAIAGWLNALVWFDIPCARRGYTLLERRALIRRNWARALGFGLAFQIGIFIPLFNVLLLTPAAAVATSVLFLHFDKGPALGPAPSPPAATEGATTTPD